VAVVAVNAVFYEIIAPKRGIKRFISEENPLIG
jgi:hypothetical protein